MTGEEAKRKLREQGITLKEWAVPEAIRITLSHASFVDRQRQFWPFTQSRGRTGHETGIERTFANSMINVLPEKRPLNMTASSLPFLNRKRECHG